MNAVARTWSLGERSRNGVGNAANAGLKGCSIGNEGKRERCDGFLDLSGWRVGEVDWCVVALNYDVDVVDVKGMTVLESDSEGCWKQGTGLDEADSVRVSSGTL